MEKGGAKGDKGVKAVTGPGPAGLQPASETNTIQRRRLQHKGRGGGDDRNMAKGLVQDTKTGFGNSGNWASVMSQRLLTTSQESSTTPLPPLAPPPLRPPCFDRLPRERPTGQEAANTGLTAASCSF